MDGEKAKQALIDFMTHMGNAKYADWLKHYDCVEVLEISATGSFGFHDLTLRARLHKSEKQ